MQRLVAHGAEIAWTSIGPPEGPTLVFCHGMALDHRDLVPLAEAAAAAGWRAVLWDMPGHGQSQPAPRDWSVAAMADALENVFDAAAVDRAMLLGFSFGGMVAQEFARRHSDRILGLIAYACFAPALTGPLVPRWAAGMLTWLLWGRKPWGQIKAEFAALCALSAEAQALIRRRMDRVGKAGFVALSKALLTAGAVDWRPRGPLLLIRGDRDSNGAALDRAMEALAQAHGNAEQVTIREAGHCAHLDQPDAVQAALIDFLRAHRPDQHCGEQPRR